MKQPAREQSASESRSGMRDFCRQHAVLPITAAIGLDTKLGILVAVGRLNFESGGQQVQMFDASALGPSVGLRAEQMDAFRSKAFETINREDTNLATMIVFQHFEGSRQIYRLTQESLLMSLRALERRKTLLDVPAQELIEIALCDSLWLDKMVADARSQGLKEAAIVREAPTDETAEATLCSRGLSQSRA